MISCSFDLKFSIISLVEHIFLCLLSLRNASSILPIFKLGFVVVECVVSVCQRKNVPEFGCIKCECT